jgi:monoamine oxidase
VPQGSSGYSIEGGAYGQAPIPLPPLSWSELLPKPAATSRGSMAQPYLFDQIWDMQATMLQPVGGMDRIAEAIYARVKPLVRLTRRSRKSAASGAARGSCMVRGDKS